MLISHMNINANVDIKMISGYSHIISSKFLPLLLISSHFFFLLLLLLFLKARHDKRNKLIVRTWRVPRFGMRSYYPINFLRNLGMELVRTKAALHIDVDFVMMQGSYEVLLRELPLLQDNPPQHTAYIVPAFEFVPDNYQFGCAKRMGECNFLNSSLSSSRGGSSSSSSSSSIGNDEDKNTRLSLGDEHPDFGLPEHVRLGSKAALREKIKLQQAKPSMGSGPPNNDTSYEPAHVEIVNYDKWYTASAPYEATYKGFHNEPYVLISMEDECVPAYDERFCWYGGDKAEFFNHLVTLNFKTLVLHNVFMYHLPHHKPVWVKQDLSTGVQIYRLWLAALDERGYCLQKQSWYEYDNFLTFIGFDEVKRKQHELTICGRL